MFGIDSEIHKENWSNYEPLGTASFGTLRTDLGLDGKVDSGNNFQIAYVAEYSGERSFISISKYGW